MSACRTSGMALAEHTCSENAFTCRHDVHEPIDLYNGLAKGLYIQIAFLSDIVEICGQLIGDLDRETPISQGIVGRSVLWVGLI